MIEIETKLLKTLHHGNIPNGWIAVPPHLEDSAKTHCPYCNLTIESGMLRDIIPTERPEPEPEPPSELESLQQAVAELSILMAGVMTNNVQ